MEAMRQSWTDDRLDDLSRRMDERFDGVERDIRELRSDLSGEIGELRKDNHALHADLLSLQRTIIHAGVALFSGMMGVIAAIVGVVITQL